MPTRGHQRGLLSRYVARGKYRNRAPAQRYARGRFLAASAPGQRVAKRLSLRSAGEPVAGAARRAACQIALQLPFSLGGRTYLTRTCPGTETFPVWLITP
jgi:hypothetical protein